MTSAPWPGDKNDLCLCGKLVDKFGDNGIVTVVGGRQQGDVLDLTLWLMSCRVLKRGMEDAMMDTVVAEAAARRGQNHRRPLLSDSQKRHGCANFTRNMTLPKRRRMPTAIRNGRWTSPPTRRSTPT